jgi:hypothetical protein
MIILGDKALDHLGSPLRVLVLPIYKSRLALGYETNLNVITSPSAWFSYVGSLDV